MKEKLIDFIEEHRRDAILLAIVLVIIIVVVISSIVRAISSKKQKAEPTEPAQTVTEQPQGITQDTVSDEPEPSEYQSSLALDKDKDSDGRVTIEEKEEQENLENYELTGLTEPKYEVSTQKIYHTEVEDILRDGTNLIAYANNSNNGKYSHGFGSALTEADFIGTTQYLVGVAKELQDTGFDMNIYKGNSFQSTGWLISNLDNLKDTDSVKFTNLRVVKNLSDTNTKLLCVYSYFSVFGLKDVMVYFEDNSGTIAPNTYVEGDMFSAVAFKHNIKIDNVDGYNVLNVQYFTFPEGMTVVNPTSLIGNMNVNWLGPINFYDENNTANFAIYWHYRTNEEINELVEMVGEENLPTYKDIEVHILYPNGVYDDDKISTEFILNADGTYDLQVIYDVDKSVRTTLYKSKK